MSFVLEFRKKMQEEAGKTAKRKTAVEKSDGGFAVRPAKRNADTAGNRRKMLAALSLAAIILSVFNSGSMVQYAGGLSYNSLSMQVITASERWHQIMEENRMTALVEEIRSAVEMARQSSWTDLAFGIASTSEASMPEAPAAPQKVTDPAVESAPVESEPEQQQAEPQGPVMRASVDPIN